jgi:hypothetical protein
MTGLGGAAPNGRSARIAYPTAIGGDVALRIMDALPVVESEASPEVERMADRVSAWVAVSLGVELSSDTVDAIIYVLDRLIAGVTRGSLRRGGSSALRNDPAMCRLGFTPVAAARFTSWLIGPDSRTGPRPSVLDAVIDPGGTGDLPLARWRDQALRLGLGVATPLVA